MKLYLKIWRQANQSAEGTFKRYELNNVSAEASFLEMLDLLNEELIERNEEPVAFDHDCREGICGMCSLVINGVAHGPQRATTTCQLHMRHFKDGDTITIEPWRARAFPVVCDLVVDRTGMDRVIQSGGFISARAGNAPESNSMLVGKPWADRAMDAAECIGCGACVAACKNASAMLFVAAKSSHLNTLPQGKPEKDRRVLAMVETMDEAGFGNCSNYGECEAVCPKGISLDFIAQLNRDYAMAKLKQCFHAPVGGDKGGAG
ncbi:MAG: succinate dehydrogenase [Verrucomicrobia bacterium 21-51-4]|nr:MAG: succinate dehydrogenase [Verrucomicrobia bacterium 21-51-4]HQU09527.1 succinate dehydrogenase/fumarate reductase iron-sulfur subunit [Opitutales bacterium]